MRSSLDRHESYRHCRTALQCQELRMLLILRMAVTFFSLALFAVIVLSALSIVFLAGFGKMALSEKLILLITATVAQVAAIFITIAKFLFPK